MTYQRRCDQTLNRKAAISLLTSTRCINGTLADGCVWTITLNHQAHKQLSVVMVALPQDTMIWGGSVVSVMSLYPVISITVSQVESTLPEMASVLLESVTWDSSLICGISGATTTPLSFFHIKLCSTEFFKGLLHKNCWTIGWKWHQDDWWQSEENN